MGKTLETSMDMINEVSNTIIMSGELGYGLSKKTEPAVETKRCSKCGQVLPITDFNKSKANKDGLQNYCRDCQKHFAAERNKKLSRNESVYQKVKEEKEDVKVHNLSKVYAHSELARFTPRQLMEELKQRGYRWEYMIEPQKRIYFNKI
jgi:predicted HTH domain antitoxin